MMGTRFNEIEILFNSLLDDLTLIPANSSMLIFLFSIYVNTLNEWAYWCVVFNNSRP